MAVAIRLRREGTKNLVDLHGGTFTLRSKLRIGTEVIVTFPPERVISGLAPMAEPTHAAPEPTEAPEIVTSVWIDEQLADTYERTGLKPGTLSSLAGIEARRWWPADMPFDEAAAKAGQQAIDASGIDPSRITRCSSMKACGVVSTLYSFLNASVCSRLARCLSSTL